MKEIKSAESGYLGKLKTTYKKSVGSKLRKTEGRD